MTPSAGRCGTCGCRSPTAATCAANTACRRTTTSGCRARTCCTSRKPARWSTCSSSLGVDKIRLTGGEPLLRRDLAGAGADDRGQAGSEGPGAHDQRRAARRSDRRAEGRRARPHHGQPRHAAPRSLQGADALRSARRRPRRHRRGAARVRPAEDRHGRHSRRQRRRAGSADRVRATRSTARSGSSSTWTSAAPAAGRPSASFSRRRCSTRWRATTARSSPIDEPGSSAPAERFALAGRHDVRHHRVDDRSVLPHVRPQPADGRRHVVPVPVRDARPRSARAAARGLPVEELQGADRRRLGVRATTAAPKIASRSAIGAPSCRCRIC